MIISIIVAMDRKGVIGKEGKLPWRLLSDLKHFKKNTMGKPIIMGRKTHESIGRPLPGRENIVLTRDRNYQPEGCTVFNDLESIYAHCKNNEEVMIMGGADLYRQTLPSANRIYLTEVYADCEGDTYFPEFTLSEWKEIERENYSADENNEFDYSFKLLERI